MTCLYLQSMDARFVCVALQTRYMLVDIESAKLLDLFPYDRETVQSLVSDWLMKDELKQIIICLFPQLDFNDDDFFDEIKTTVVSETKQQIPSQFDSNVATSSIINPPKSLEVTQ